MRFKKSMVAAGVALTLTPLSLLALSNPASAYNPTGSGVEIFTEPSLTGDIHNQITAGWWGRETNPGDNTAAGDSGPNATFFSSDLTDGGTAFANAFNGDDGSHVGIAYVPTSADGSAERPAVTAGELAGQAFQWYSDAPAFGSVQWNANSNPGVDGLWTQAGKDQWVADGKPSTAFDSTLVQHTPLVAGDPVAPHQYQTSLLNTWPAGTKVSLVFFLYDGFNANGEPIVHVGSDGHAVTAWEELQTVAGPSNPTLKTSAGYKVLSAGVIKANSTTTLAASPSAAQPAGTPIDLTATVSPTSATGTVEFFDGSTSLGTANVSGGTATLSGQTFTQGTHSLSAVYSGDSNNNGSTGTFSLTANHSPAAATTTTLSVNPGTATAFGAVSMTATVTPHAAGTVNFIADGTHNLGSATVDTSTGQATLTTYALGQGAHSVQATFVPDDSASYIASSSDVQGPFTLAAPTSTPDVQNLQAEIDPGSLTITTPYTPTSPLDLGKMTLDPASGYSASAPFTGIQILDTRAGALPWTASAIASNLTNGGTGANDVINGQNVGLTGVAVDSNNNTSPSSVVAATQNPAGAFLAPTATGNAGLGGAPHTVLTDAQGPGTVKAHGTLTLNAPTSTNAGTFTGTVTFTVS